MAKAKQPKRPAITAESIENDIRKAVGLIPGINDLTEYDYCKALADACEAIRYGSEMRMNELQQEEE